MGITIIGQEAKTPPPGWYPATIQAAQEHNGKFGRQIEFMFKLIDDRYGDMDIRTRLKPVATPGNRTGKLISAVWRQTVGNYAYDVDQMLGKGILVRIEQREAQGNKYARVVDFASLPKGWEKHEYPVDTLSAIVPASGTATPGHGREGTRGAGGEYPKSWDTPAAPSPPSGQSV